MPANLQPGEILRERYEIVGLIGAGGMGAVYLANDNRLEGRQCAIKETFPLPTLNQEVAQAARKQFFQEASTLARLDHPGLPKVSDFFSIDERDYLVMDFVAGQNLLEIVNEVRREGRFLDEATVLGWVDQLCDTLSYLHSRMLNSPNNPTVQLTWQALLWRLLLTLLLLLALAGPGLTLFRNVTNRSGTQTLPRLGQQENGEWQIGDGR